MEEQDRKEIIRLASQQGAEAALNALEKEKTKRRKERKDWRLRNTKLLLEHYQDFKKHAENSFYNIKEAIEASEQDVAAYSQLISEQSDLYVKSVMISSGRTAALMEDVDRMLNLYQHQCLQGSPEKQRRFRVIQKMYLDAERKPAVKIASEEHVSERTVYGDVNATVEDLSILIFGIDIFFDMFD